MRLDRVQVAPDGTWGEDGLRPKTLADRNQNNLGGSCVFIDSCVKAERL